MKKYGIPGFLTLLLVALLLFGCAASKDKSPSGEHLPEYEKLTALIGGTKAEALEALNLQENDLTKFVEYDYSLPMEVEYVGVKLQPGIEFIYGDENLLNAIHYRAAYEGNPAQAAKDMVAVAAQLKKLLGTPDHDAHRGLISDFKEEDLFKALEKKSLSNEDYWDITDIAPDNVKEYIKNVSSQSWWTKVYGEREARYFLLLEIDYIDTTDTAYISIRYVVQPEMLN